ncbi:copper resistance protein B [Tepidiphilus thermophilus]
MHDVADQCNRPGPDKYGKTASLARREGLEARQTRVVAGLRFWF